MPISLSITSNIDAVRKRLSAIERKQIPFATQGAINDTIKDIRKQVVGITAPRAFTLRNKQFIGAAMRMQFATKQKLTGAVFDRLGRGSLELHARGGIKRPRGQHLAVPTDAIKRTGKGVRAAMRPRRLLSSDTSRKKAFKIRFASGQEAIVRRTTKKRAPLKVLYLFERSVRIPKRFRFAEDATKVTRARFQRHFSRRLRQALRTARR